MSDVAMAVLERLAAVPGGRAEVYSKRGRSRRYEVGAQGATALLSEERGWAVRAGSERASLFAAGSGEPEPAGPWPAADGPGLRLPEAGAAARWRPPADLEAPLISERDGMNLLEGFERALQSLLPGSRLLLGVLEDGSSVSKIANSLGVRAEVRRRLASLRLEVAGPGRAPAVARLQVAAREAGGFSPAQLARLAAQRLTARGQGRPVERDRGEMVLAPAVGAAVLEALTPLVVGPRAPQRARRFRDRRGRVASSSLTLIDDGRLPDGLLTAPVDGEGSPARETVLVERGVFRQPLVSWWQARGLRARGSGCVGRPSWRALPRPGPTHLYLRADEPLPAAALLEGVRRGYWLVDTLGPVRADLEADRLAVPVCGFALRRGRADAPLTASWLCGGVGAFLQGVRAVAGDLAFQPLGAIYGCPTLLLAGLELRGRP